VTREHAPRPGRTWDTRLVAAELLLDDTNLEGVNDDPQPPRPNRATRRAQQRAARKPAR